MTASTLVYTDKTVKAGAVYTYYVTAYTGAATSTYATSTIRYIKAPTITVKKVNAGIALSWNRTSGAQKYVVYRKSSSGTYKAIKTVTYKTLSWTDNTAKKGQTYCYIVKAVNGKTSSAASAYKKIKR